MGASLSTGGSWQTNRSAVSLGRAGWAEIQRCCLCVTASMKNNKTLWGMDQIRSDRDTKTGTASLFYNFPAFLLLSFFPWLRIFLSSCLIITAWHSWPTIIYPYCLVFFFDCQRGTFLHSRTLTGVAGQLHRHEWANKHSSLPSFHFSISSSLPL